ncbi:hypothetical protein QJS04_geneDACA017611 [Acorus gramineus]|uniref:Glycosyltransferase 61 catalytic domain-containing protein n=1 Tax=Acorus gramineus TaxID=55184 RepID=A0AAV9AU24_ACOGR|nr:hypothetical protein QJS04_geneDACA017611 [Acorus gramineus]
MAMPRNVSELDGIVSIVNATSQGGDVSDSVDADPPNVGIIFHENSSVAVAVTGGSPPAQNTSNSHQLLISEKPIMNGTISNVSDSNPRLPGPDGGVRGSMILDTEPKHTISCNVSEHRSDICDMVGDVRVQGNLATVLFASSPDTDPSVRNRTWTIRPYARKSDQTVMAHVRSVTLKSSPTARPHCDVNHTVPAIVFSDIGYTGNFFHDFTDVLIPLFLTAREFRGEVQFMATGSKQWWLNKYAHVFRALSNYEVLDFDKDPRTHCFPRALVGLRCHKELSIDPARAPYGYTMSDFRAFLRGAYALNRSVTAGARAPRLLIVARKHTRSFVNLESVVRAAKKAGFEAVMMEAEVTTSVAEVARTVNSCDAMMGVHGAGLTNFLFLPMGATLVQIVPWGGLEGICANDFGIPASDSKINYFEYKISKEESTLLDIYPSDHAVFKDPMSIHKKGWGAVAEVFLKQNVKLDVRRFRPVLKKAFKSLQG